MTNSISIVIHTRNVQNGISDCIKSAQLLTNNIVIIDMESTDNTVKIAKEMGVTVFNFSYSQIVEPARAFGISKSQTNWVFLLDADERMTSELAKEIKKIIDSGVVPIKIGTPQNDVITNYQVPRKEILFHQHWLKYGGWWPNYQTRLINKQFFVNWPKNIHATPSIKGKQGLLKEPLLHYSQNDFSEIVDRTTIFEDKESELLVKVSHKASTAIFFRKFFGELYRRLIKDQGFRDGTIGIIESIYQAFSKTITYIYLYEKSRIV